MIPKQDPVTAYQQIFAPLTSSLAEQQRALAHRRNVLAAVQQDYARLKRRVSTSDLPRLQAHAESIAELQSSLDASASSCTLPSAPSGMTSSSPDFRPWAMDRHIELLTGALACGLTRVASLQFRPGENDGGSNGVYGWLSQSAEHHLTSHNLDADSKNRLADIYRWYAGRFAYLLQKLDSMPDGDGTLLDHTLVIWGSEIGNGYDHQISNIPFIVAGGGRAGIRTGRYIKFPSPAFNNRLLVSACKFMGYSDVQTFGSLDTGTGPLATLHT